MAIPFNIYLAISVLSLDCPCLRYQLSPTVFRNAAWVSPHLRPAEEPIECQVYNRHSAVLALNCGEVWITLEIAAFREAAVVPWHLRLSGHVDRVSRRLFLAPRPSVPSHRNTASAAVFECSFDDSNIRPISVADLSHSTLPLLLLCLGVDSGRVLRSGLWASYSPSSRISAFLLAASAPYETSYVTVIDGIIPLHFRTTDLKGGFPAP